MPLSIHAKTRVEEKLRGGSTLNQRWQPAAAEVEVIANVSSYQNSDPAAAATFKYVFSGTKSRSRI